MKAIKATIAAWSREDLVRTAVAMMNIAGWALALVLVAYILRFGLPASLQLRMYGAETTEQLLNAKAAWGQFGEFVGGTLGPLVSLLALVALVFTVLLQQEAMIRAQSDTDLSKQVLAKQTRLTLETARLQSLAAALDVTSEMHRQALQGSHVSAIELLKRKEALAGQILEINERLAREALASASAD